MTPTKRLLALAWLCAFADETSAFEIAVVAAPKNLFLRFPSSSYEENRNIAKPTTTLAASKSLEWFEWNTYKDWFSVPNENWHFMLPEETKTWLDKASLADLMRYRKKWGQIEVRKGVITEIRLIKRTPLEITPFKGLIMAEALEIAITFVESKGNKRTEANRSIRDFWGMDRNGFFFWMPMDFITIGKIPGQDGKLAMGITEIRRRIAVTLDDRVIFIGRRSDSR